MSIAMAITLFFPDSLYVLCRSVSTFEKKYNVRTLVCNTISIARKIVREKVAFLCEAKAKTV